MIKENNFFSEVYIVALFNYFMVKRLLISKNAYIKLYEKDKLNIF